MASERTTPDPASLSPFDAFFRQSRILHCFAKLSNEEILRLNDDVSSLEQGSREELMDLPFSRFVNPEDESAASVLLASLHAGQPLLGVNVKRTGTSGNEIHFEWNIIPDLENDMIYAMAVDVTGVNQARADLEESSQRYIRLVSNATDIIYRFHYLPEPGFDFISPAVEAIVGYTPEEMYANPILGLEIIHEEDRKALQDFISGKSSVRPHVARWFHKNGSTVWIEDRHVPIIENGQLIAIEGIARDVSERKHAQQQIERDLEEKVVLLREINHRVKNNLNVITSLLNLQLDRVKGNVEAAKALEESRDRIYSMALVHNLLYDSGDFSSIDMRPYIETISNRLWQVNTPDKDISFEFDVEDVIMDVTTAIPCGLILNELITNIYKHAFADRTTGNIFIALRAVQDGDFEMIVRDDGAGLPKDLAVEKTDSLGLHLVSLLIEQLNGSLEIESKGGTSFKFLFAGQLDSHGSKHSKAKVF